jgi:hypothetical protein
VLSLAIPPWGSGKAESWRALKLRHEMTSFIDTTQPTWSLRRHDSGARTVTIKAVDRLTVCEPDETARLQSSFPSSQTPRHNECCHGPLARRQENSANTGDLVHQAFSHIVMESAADLMVVEIKPGGSEAPKGKRLCKTEGCTRVIKSQGHCQRHGAKTKRCRVDGE